MNAADHVVWHDLECGSYLGDLALWLELAAATPGPVLDVGAGTGRVSLPLARAGHRVHALDSDPVLLAALAARAGALPVSCVCADACTFTLGDDIGLCIVPMQTIHLLADRLGFLCSAHAVLRPGGLLAVALLGAGVEPFEVELEPERVELSGVLYESRPTALRLDAGAVILERRRERTDATGLRAEADLIRLAPLSARVLAREAAAAGLEPYASRTVAPTADRAGSDVLIMRRPARPCPPGTRPR